MPLADREPSFSKVARKIGETDWLEKALHGLARTVATDINNAKFSAKRSEVRGDVKQLKAKTRKFERALDRVSKRWLDLPMDEIECLPKARKATRDIIALCDKTLLIISGKAGPPKKPGRVVCAMIVIEAWALARRGKPPSQNNLDAQDACEAYWQACRGSPVETDEGRDWRRSIGAARNRKDELRQWIRTEMGRYARGT